MTLDWSAQGFENAPNSKRMPGPLKVAEPAGKPKKKKRKQPEVVTHDDGFVEVECNTHIIREIADDMKVPIYLTEGILHHYCSFIADTIRAGAMEGVFVPYLGKFQVKLEAQQYKAYLHSLHPVMKRVFENNPPELVNEVLKIDKS